MINAAVASTPFGSPVEDTCSDRERAADRHRVAALGQVEAMRLALIQLDLALRVREDECAFRASAMSLGRALEGFDTAIRTLRAVRDCRGEA